jgi:phage shock protein E
MEKVMKSFLWIGLVSLMLFVLIAQCKKVKNSSDNAGVFTELSPVEAQQVIGQLANDKNFVLIDVRTPDEFNAGHIAGAMNLNFHDPGFRNSLNSLDKTKTYMIYCRSGNRSGQTFNLMKSLPFHHVYHIIGGIIAWQRDQLPLQ